MKVKWKVDIETFSQFRHGGFRADFLGSLLVVARAGNWRDEFWPRVGEGLFPGG